MFIIFCKNKKTAKPDYKIKFGGLSTTQAGFEPATDALAYHYSFHYLYFCIICWSGL